MTALLRGHAVQIYSQGLLHITPEHLLRQALLLEPRRLRITFLDRQESLPLAGGTRIVLLAIGKAAAPMAQEAQRLLGQRIARGLVVTKYGFGLPGLPWPLLESGHPVPDEQGVRAAQAVEELARSLAAEDVLLVLVSGGASALLPAPIPGVSLADKQQLVQAMLRTNMDIHQINRVRKAISRLKGGGLAALAGAATVVGLYLSDVPGDDLGSIGSGPTVPEAADAAPVRALLEEKGLWAAAPASIRAALTTGSLAPKHPQRPPLNGLIGSNRHLLRALAQAALSLDYAPQLVEAPVTGLNAEAVPVLLRRWQAAQAQAPRGALCLVSGGETTVEVRGHGLGGRCQELAALMWPHLDGQSVFLAAGSDGNDGPTDAAGGVVDEESWRAAQAAGVPYAALLEDHDSYHLLERTGNLIRVPPTRNNVMDVYLFLRPGPAHRRSGRAASP